MFSGSITALITPFKGGQIDKKAFEDLVNWQIVQGSNGLVICGTTGEAPTLTDEEQDWLLTAAIQVAGGRVPIIMGTGTNDTSKTLSRTRNAEKIGAAAALVVSPYYNKPTQEGLYQHFKLIHDETGLPIIIYNIPGRAAVDIQTSTLLRLADFPRIVGIKDATADLARPLILRAEIGDRFCQLSGEDATVVAFLAQGGDGCISVTSNIVPNLCAELHRAWHMKDWQKIAHLRDLLLPLHQAMFVETNPGPVKYAASLLGLCKADVRLPVFETSDASKKLIKQAVSKVGLVV